MPPIAILHVWGPDSPEVERHRISERGYRVARKMKQGVSMSDRWLLDKHVDRAVICWEDVSEQI
jgi:hypothetical protein